MSWLIDLHRDAAYALRTFSRDPAFTTVAILTLTLGIGANTAIFSVVHAVLLKSLPYATQGDRIVRLMAHVPSDDSPGAVPRRIPVLLSAAEARDLAARARSLSHAGIAGGTVLSLRGREEAARLSAARLSVSIFPTLGARPLLGRVFNESDEADGAAPVALLANAAWHRFFAGDPGIVGRTVVLESVLGARVSRAFTVTGVMPPEFEQFPGPRTQLWTPMPAAVQGRAVRAPVVARLADGITVEAALAECDPIVRGLRQDAAGVRYELVREHDEIVAAVRPALLALSGAVGCILLIACANVANLMLARSLARRHEMSVRAALGASRGRLLRQAFTECLVLAALGGAVALLLASGSLVLLRGLASPMPRFDLAGGPALPRLQEIGLDPTTLAFTAVVAIAAGLVLGLAPALRARAFERVVTSASEPRSHANGSLVVAEIALATTLLAGAGLLINSFGRLARVAPGYDASNVLTFQVALPAETYPDALTSFAEALVERIRSVPGVGAAAYANQLPMVQLRDTAGGLARAPNPSRRSSPDGPDARFVSRGYFGAMGIRIVEGRGFTESDGAGQPRVLVVNEALARREFPNANPLGQAVYIGRDPLPWRIVGVVADVRQFALDRAPEPQFFVDVRQWSGGMPLFPVGAYYAVRTAADPRAIVPALRSVVRELEPQAALFNVAPMDEVVAGTIRRPRMFAVLLALFAAIGMALALIGIYGVTAYAVVQRTREIGIRMALGARSGSVVGLVLGRAVALSAAGILLGLAGAAGLTRYLEGMLFDLDPLDPATFTVVAVAFLSCAAAAACLPARRAATIDPLVTLRCE